MQTTELVGIKIDPEQAFRLIEYDLKTYNDEFKKLPLHSTGVSSEYHIINSNYMAIDGNLYYSLIRYYRPKKIIEIGSGNSTLLASTAIRKNNAESPEHITELISIEPYPRSVMKQEIPELTQLIEKKVQDVDLSIFEDLGSGDILFIDSSHVLRSGGDVWWEFCEILPRLATGVLIHIHDISLPKPYPDVYMRTHLYWNEQYLLQAFLTYNTRFKVIWPGNYLMTNYPQRMREIFSPEYDRMREKYPESEPSAFWMRVNDSSQ